MPPSPAPPDVEAAPPLEQHHTNGGVHARVTIAPTLSQHKHATADALQAVADNKSLAWGTRRALTRHYRRQMELLGDFADMETVHQGGAPFDDAAERILAQRALNLSFVSNVVLLGVRVAMAAIAGSLSLIIAMIDAILDVLSSCLMYFAAWEAKKTDNRYRYPVGKGRLEPLGVIVFSCIMGTAAFSVIVEGIKQLVGGDSSAEDGLPHQWIIIGGTIFVVLFKLLLFLYCRRSKAVAVQAFATDHLNDVLVNSFSLAGALLGANVAWWTDPFIAILLSFWVIYAWGRQGLSQLVTLVGVSAPPEVLQKLTYLAVRHRSDVVIEVDTVRAYTAGTELVAEVDIVLPGTMALQDAHDVGETLQVKLESLPGVTRAFVHLDVESRHRPEHS